MKQKGLKSIKVVVRLVSLEYCVDNFYVDYEDGYVYLSEDDYLRNKREPVFSYIAIGECGTILETDKGSITYDIADFVEEEFTPEEHPEYYI